MADFMRKRRKRKYSESSLAETYKSPITLPEPPPSEGPSSPTQMCRLGMDGHFVATKLLPQSWTRSPASAYLTQYQSEYGYCRSYDKSSPKRSYEKPSPKRSYNICFCLPLCWKDKDDENERWYTININADGPGKGYPEPLIPFWKGKLPDLCGFAALGSHIYCFGGYNRGDKEQEAIRDVYQLQVTPCVAKGREWVPVSPMTSPRIFPYASVLGSKIFVRNSPFFLDRFDSTNGVWGEVFDPVNGKWEAVPKPPMTGDEILSGTLENPDRILVAIREPDDRFSVVLFLYTVQRRFWKKLGARTFDTVFDDSWARSTVIVGNILYWVEHKRLCAYDLYADIWLNGSLKVLGKNFFDEEFHLRGGSIPYFLHLEKQRFCFVKRLVEDCVSCVIVDVSPLPDKKTLGISVAWKQEYAIEPTSANPDEPIFITDCVVLGN